MVIGLSLAPVAVDMASNAGETYSAGAALGVAGAALLATMLTALLAGAGCGWCPFWWVWRWATWWRCPWVW